MITEGKRMGLTGLEIFKLLPQTNCRDCGFPTCLAFAMKLAAKQVEPGLCPTLSAEASAILSASASPPVVKVEMGPGSDAVTVGEETVLFRHEKTFVHHTAFVPVVRDSLTDEELMAAVQRIEQCRYERAGETLRIDMIGIECDSGNPSRFEAAIETITGAASLPLVLCSEDVDVLDRGLARAGRNRPLVYRAAPVNCEPVLKLAAHYRVPVVLGGFQGYSGLEDAVGRADAAGVGALVLECPRGGELADDLRFLTAIRRWAIEERRKEYGFPTLVTLRGDSREEDAARAALATCRYGSIVLFRDFELWEMFPLLALRQNIYTDPQKPLQVDAKVYEIGEPGERAPLFVTTNFSLTYFVVSTEMEGSGIPSYLLVVDAEGMSVLTAWSAGKFTAEIIAGALRKSGIESRIAHRSLILPGHVSMLSGEVEDQLPGWKIIVGPQEAIAIPAFLKELRCNE